MQRLYYAKCARSFPTQTYELEEKSYYATSRDVFPPLVSYPMCRVYIHESASRWLRDLTNPKIKLIAVALELSKLAA